jgi:hypothetical protein
VVKHHAFGFDRGFVDAVGVSAQIVQVDVGGEHQDVAC